MAFIASSNDRSRRWFVSLANRKEGEDMELNNWMSLEHVVALSPSR